jgi:hypothetical protein
MSRRRNGNITRSLVTRQVPMMAANSRTTIALISCLRNAPSVPLPRRLIIPSWSQGKPAVERDSSDSIGRRDQPQAVTRHLFAPLPLTVQQQQQQQEQPQLSCRPSPQTATASIFAPRTEDMNKGFLTFSEDQPGLTSVYLSLRNQMLFNFRLAKSRNPRLPRWYKLIRFRQRYKKRIDVGKM